jgi:hypothetical protein
MNEMIIQCNHIYSNGIEISDDTALNTLLSADDHVISSDLEEDLQSAFCITPTKQFGIKTSPLKAKLMTLKRQFSITSKIVIDSTVWELVNTFTYLGRKIPYAGGKD